MPSFQDSNGDGLGDLPGIHRRLSYLVDLGVGAVWLSPFYRSELYDLGYDVTDHTSVDPRFGTLEDFDRLLNAAHDHGLGVVIDFVPNHTSRRHSWFEQSRSSRGNPKRAWFLWADSGRGGGPPNNWINRFGRSAWHWDAATKQYYFGTFTPRQPDLNWRNEEVRKAQYDVMRFWLDRGVDGLRIDALPHLIKDRRLRDNPPNSSYTDEEEPSNKLMPAYTANQPELLEVIRELRMVVDEYEDRVMIGEAYQPLEQLAAYQRAGVQVLLNTSLLGSELNANALRVSIDRAEGITLDGDLPSWSAGNHDIPRLAERVGDHNTRLAALLLFTVRGAASCYYGDELGLKNGQVPPAAMKDPSGRDNPVYGRDRVRTPMPWSGEAHGGFSTVAPWLPMDACSLQQNVAQQQADPNSLWNFYRALLRVRSEESDLVEGTYTPIDCPEPILAFRRGPSDRGLLVALDVSDETALLQLDNTGARVVISTSGRKPGSPLIFPLQLGPREGLVARCGTAESTHSAPLG